MMNSVGEFFRSCMQITHTKSHYQCWNAAFVCFSIQGPISYFSCITDRAFLHSIPLHFCGLKYYKRGWLILDKFWMILLKYRLYMLLFASGKAV